MDYQPLYTTLFNAITDALEALEAQNIGQVKALLAQAQQKTEEQYISQSPEQT